MKQLETTEKNGTYIAPIEIAMADIALGKRAEGLARIREAIDDRSFNLVFNVSDPVFDLVRDDAQFAALMNKINVPAACWRDAPRYRKQ